MEKMLGMQARAFQQQFLKVLLVFIIFCNLLVYVTLEPYITHKQGRKRPLDTPKRMIKRREREGKREKER